VQNPSLAVDYVVATPQMVHYMKASAQIYGIYLKYVAPEDIFAYSVNDVFIDATGYLSTYNTNGHGITQHTPHGILSASYN
jgi:DNA polymerase V